MTPSPQPLDRFAAVLHGAALHQPRNRRRQISGRIVAAFLGEPRVSADIEEADRRLALEAAVDPSLRHHHLEAFDDVGDPGASLLRVVHGQEGLLRKRGDPVGEVGVRDLLRALARHHGWLDHLGVPPGPFLFGDPRGAVALHTEETLDRGRPESFRELEFDERHDRHLIVAKSVIGRWLRHADRFADDHQQLQRDPGPVADLAKRLGAECSESLVTGSVEEGERQGTARDTGGHTFERDPDILERLRHQHPPHVARRETIRIHRGKDAEIHESNEIGGLDSDALGGDLA